MIVNAVNLLQPGEHPLYRVLSPRLVHVLSSKILSPHGELRSITNSCQARDVDIMGIGPKWGALFPHALHSFVYFVLWMLLQVIV